MELPDRSLPAIDPSTVNKLLNQAMQSKSLDELFSPQGPVLQIFKPIIEAMLKAEMTEHLGYESSDARSKKTTNSRNGTSSKTLKTTAGAVQIDVPRDRDGSFEPKIIGKHQTKTNELEKRIISLYAKGMSTNDICTQIAELYCDVQVSAGFISQVTEKVLPLAREWQGRQLEEIYPVIFFDAIHYKVREEGRIVVKAVYVVLAITLEGKREVLGFYIGESESASFWMQVFSDLQNRGVKDILIACVDGLKGLPKALNQIYPKTEIQLCVVHQIRNSIKYVGSANQREFLQDLKKVYTSSNESLALAELGNLELKWQERYPVVTRSWRQNWEHLSTFFKYPPAIRTMIYTTNIIEGFNRQLRKVTKNKGLFPSNDSLFKLLYLATMDAAKKWTMPRHNWALTIGQLSIYFEGRFKLPLL